MGREGKITAHYQSSREGSKWLQYPWLVGITKLTDVPKYATEMQFSGFQFIWHVTWTDVSHNIRRSFRSSPHSYPKISSRDIQGLAQSTISRYAKLYRDAVATTIDTYPADVVEWVARLAADAAVFIVLLQQMRVVGAQLGLAVVRSDEGHVQAVHDGALQVSWNRVTRWNWNILLDYPLYRYQVQGHKQGFVTSTFPLR